MSLKSIKDTDDNKKLKDLPDEIFGYIGAGDLLKISGSENPIDLRIRSDIHKTARKTTWYFRINKYSSKEIKLLGYISGQANSLINQKKDLLDVDIQVFPTHYQEYVHEREFKLSDESLRIKPRYIADSSVVGNAQWLLDISRENINSLVKDHDSEKNLKRPTFEKPFYKKYEFWIPTILAFISIPWWPAWFLYLINFIKK